MASANDSDATPESEPTLTSDPPSGSRRGTSIGSRGSGPGPRGVDFGSRLFALFPTGHATANHDALADRFTTSFGLSLELGYRIDPNLSLLATYGIAKLGFSSALPITRACDDTDSYDTTCEARLHRGAAFARYRFTPKERLSFAVEGGLGYEWVEQSVSNGDYEALKNAGPALLLGAGVELRLGRWFRLSPGIDAWVGRYTTYSYSREAGQRSSGAVDAPATHAWIGLGLRGVFSL